MIKFLSKWIVRILSAFASPVVKTSGETKPIEQFLKAWDIKLEQYTLSKKLVDAQKVRAEVHGFMCEKVKQMEHYKPLDKTPDFPRDRLNKWREFCD